MGRYDRRDRRKYALLARAESQLASAVDLSQNIPSCEVNQTYNIGQICVQLRILTSCGSGQYISSEHTETSARECSCVSDQTYNIGDQCIPLAVCRFGSYIDIPHTETTDRICSPVTI